MESCSTSQFPVREDKENETNSPVSILAASSAPQPRTNRPICSKFHIIPLFLLPQIGDRSQALTEPIIHGLRLRVGRVDPV